MRAGVFFEHGSPEVMQVAEVPDPCAGRDGVLVRIRAAALNHLDLWIRRGIDLELSYPHIGGADIAGEIADLGSEVSPAWKLAPGDRVLINPSLWCGQCEWCQRGEHSLCAGFRIVGEHVNGGFAEHVVVPPGNVHKIPAWMSYPEAAAVPLVYQTAWRGLMTQGGLRAGETVLVTGASGGVASAAIQIAHLAGARVYAVTKGEERVEAARRLGADVVYDRGIEDWCSTLWADTGRRGVDVVVDSVGAAHWRQCLRSLARGGRLVTYGATTGPFADTDVRLVFWKQIRIIGSTMASASEFHKVLELVFARRLQPVIDRSFALEDIRAAHEYLEDGGQFGKVMIDIG
ncbi:MAG: zinc-binding dehydrogenase [Candidatus Schekmanbacteria bacterium]|nr:zinc-binding dehydrogenase [Candidatus Schekmanbacteria bacterium]